MEVETAERWVKLVTGPASALVILLAVVALLVYWIETELAEGKANQQTQIDLMQQGQALMAENQKILTELLETQRQEQESIRLLLFRNVDTPEQP